MGQRVLNNLFITHVDKEGPFLKILGQTNRNSAIFIEQVLFNFAPQFDSGFCVPQPETLQVGLLCCVKYKDNKYYRARIINLNFLNNGYAELNLIDHGIKDVVPIANIRSLNGFDSAFISVPPQGFSFLLSEAVCSGGEWSDVVLDEVAKEIRYSNAHFTVIAQIAKHYLVRIFIGNVDLAVVLIERGFMRHTSLTTQEAVLLSTMPRSPPATTNSQQQSIARYKSHVLEPGGLYPVYVSYVSEGPCNFSVQLKQSEEILAKLMKDINSINLTPFEELPTPGSLCLAKCMEDGNVCRAVITNEVDGNFKVYYVDFGNFEVIPPDAIFEIPFKFVIHKVMAIRFALSGVEKSTVTIEMQCAFKQFVDNRLMQMKVVPTKTRTALSRCELWDAESKISALDVIKQAASSSYPDVLSLNRGFSQVVKVSYVYSCNRFYVQLKNREDELVQLMINIQQICQANDCLSPDKIKVGLPCIALFETDQQWYRSQIVECYGNGFVKVIYIDYGNEELIGIDKLKPIDGQILIALRPQAIECCLNGYQNMEPEEQRDNLLEELILEQEFTMRVVEVQNGKALVDLFNESNYNVASLLLDKIATSRSQISSLLVQAGNKIEQRKSSYPSNRTDRYDRNERNDRNDRKFSPRSRDGAENNETDWRQNNKTFSRREREDSNHSTDKDGWAKKSSPMKNESYKKPFTANGDAGDSWEAKRSNRSNMNTSDDWGTEAQNKTDSWGADDNKKGGDRYNQKPFRKDHDGDDRRGNKEWNSDNRRGQHKDWNNDTEKKPYAKRNDRFQNDDSQWNSDPSKSGGYKKKPDFKREPSNASSSGSEKGYKGFKKSTPPRQSRYEQQGQWSPVETVPNAASTTDEFLNEDVTGLETQVSISWFHNPGRFYCQIQENQSKFKQMMEDIQNAYQTRKPSQCVVGAPVVGYFPEDGVLYRAKVLAVLGQTYKILFVDFGNISSTEKIWPIEKRFMELPSQAICCTLNGVIPNGENWLSGEQYAKYFDKPSFSCKFLAVESDKTLVNLQYEDKDIATLLVEDGLALYSQPPIPDIEVPFLIGQQFAAMLTSVNSLSDFTMLLHCGILLTCKLYNLEKASETFEDLLKENLQQILIVYVNNIEQDERLEVTLYDNLGNLLSLMDKNEGAFDFVEVLCPTLLLTPNLSGVVTHVEESTIFVQPHDLATTVDTLLNQLYEAYNSLEQETRIAPVEGFVYAVLSSDANWYRGKVVSFDNEEATVSYIDYGNTEVVRLENIRELFSEYMDYQILCVQVTMTVPVDELLNNDVTLTLTLGEDGWEGTLISNVYIETNVEEQTNLETQQEDLESGQAVPEQEEPIPQPADLVPQPEQTPQETEPTSDVQVQAQPEQGIPVILSHVDSPSDFYITLTEASNKIEELQENLQTEIEQMKDLENPTVGALCAAPFSVDQLWYRAQVLDFDNDITTVRFVDFGNTDVIDNSSTQIKTLPPNLLQLELYATRCRLNIKPVDSEWSQAATERFTELTGVENLTAQFINKDGKTDYVELYSNGVNIKDVLIAENLAVSDQAIRESGLICFVSHLNSPSEFWIQLENFIDDLERIADQLSTAESFPELEDFTPGTLCAALFPDDELWYRARILSNTVAGREVLFIDYGNSCTSCSLRELPEDLLMLPPLAQKCSLSKPAGLQQWTSEMNERFNEISDEGRTTFTVQKLSAGETALVELLIEGRNVTEIILDESAVQIAKNESESQNIASNILEQAITSTENLMEAKNIVNGIIHDVLNPDENEKELESLETEDMKEIETPQNEEELESPKGQDTKEVEQFDNGKADVTPKSLDYEETEKFDSPEKSPDAVEEIEEFRSPQVPDEEFRCLRVDLGEKLDDIPEHSDSSKVMEDSFKSAELEASKSDDSQNDLFKTVADLEEIDESKYKEDSLETEKKDLETVDSIETSTEVEESSTKEAETTHDDGGKIKESEEEKTEDVSGSDEASSRPASRLSGKISHDDRIPSGVISSPKLSQ